MTTPKASLKPNTSPSVSVHQTNVQQVSDRLGSSVCPAETASYSQWISWNVKRSGPRWQLISRRQLSLLAF